MPRWLVLVALFALANGDTTIQQTGSQATEAKEEAPATNPCVAGTKLFFFTGHLEQIVAPTGCVFVMSLWGAGGSNSIRGAGGGGGGYIRGAILGKGHTLYVMVGEGAVGQVENDTAWPGQGPFYGGGGHQGNYCGHAGGGGGRTQVSMQPFAEDVDGVLLVAGGGGGAGTCQGSYGGSGGGRDDVWVQQSDGLSCIPGNKHFGKGGYGGRPHNDFFNGHPGGDRGGGGGGGYYAGGAGEGHCDYGSGGGGGSSFSNADYVFAVEILPGNGANPGKGLTDYGLSTGVGGTGVNGGGGHGLAMFNWYPDPNYGKENKFKMSA